MILRFWLWLFDLSDRIGAPWCVQAWLICRASDATDWGEPEGESEDPPW
jgi:hypothetical protein